MGRKVTDMLQDGVKVGDMKAVTRHFIYGGYLKATANIPGVGEVRVDMLDIGNQLKNHNVEDPCPRLYNIDPHHLVDGLRRAHGGYLEYL